MYQVTDRDLISIDGWRVPPGFRSDGCTCAPDVIGGVDLRAACIWHDWARRHLVHYGRLTVPQADALLHRFLVELFERDAKLNRLTRWIARAYWAAAKVMRSRFTATLPLPFRAWEHYLTQDSSSLGIIARLESFNG